MLGIPIAVITSSAIELKICVITEGIKKYKPIIKKKKKKHEKIVLLTKTKLNSTEGVISKALIDSNITHDEFVLIDNMLKEYDEMKEETKTFNRSSDLAASQLNEDFALFIKILKICRKKYRKWKSRSCEEEKRTKNAHSKCAVGDII